MNTNWIIITGASGGIGRNLAELLADMDYGVIMACRNMEKASPIFEDVKYITSNRDMRLFEVDLSSFESIKNFVRQVDEKGYNVRALVNNAGVISRGFSTTADGFETTVGVNYIGTYLLTRLMMPILKRSEGLSRIMNTVSVMAKLGRVEKDFFTPKEEGFRRLRTYACSKLALMMFTQSLAERLKGSDSVVVNAYDPGVVNTDMITMGKWFDPLANIFLRPLLKNAEKAASQQCDALFPEKERGSGWVYKGNRHFRIRDFAASHRNKDWLFMQTERILVRDFGVSLEKI